MNGASLEASARPCAVMYMPCATAYTRLVPYCLDQPDVVGNTPQPDIVEREHDVRGDHQTDGCRIHDAPMRGRYGKPLCVLCGARIEIMKISPGTKQLASIVALTWLADPVKSENSWLLRVPLN